MDHSEPVPIDPAGSNGDRTPYLPNTPPPSLDFSSTSKLTYTLPDLLSLAQTPHRPPNPQRLNSFSSILRRGSVVDDSQWGVDEEWSDILEGKSVAACLPVPPLSTDVSVGMGGAAGKGMTIKLGAPSRATSRSSSFDTTSEVVFAFQSVERAAPVLIDFNNPNPFAKAVAGGTRKPSASSVFQSFPAAPNTSSANLAAQTMGERFASLRQSSLSSLTRNRALSTTSSSASSPSASPSLGKGQGLNPFAAPFPLPAIATSIHSTPPTNPSNPSCKPRVAPSPIQAAETASLPLPKTLPASLPKKPGPIAPVFVKRESAALPQPMSLPDIAPMGTAWEGEGGLSGNDKRRRASEVIGTIGLGMSASLGAGLGNGSVSLAGPPAGRCISASTIPRAMSTPDAAARIEEKREKRPERLVMLGQRLRASVAAKGIKT